MHAMDSVGRNSSTVMRAAIAQALIKWVHNGCHLNILLFLFKLALDASFLSLKFKRIFCLERVITVTGLI